MAKGSNSYDDFNRILSDLENGTISPIYLLHGEEHHFLDAMLAKIEEKVLDESTKSFNHHVFYGKESNALDIINTCKRFPMMADYQLVVVKEAQRLLKADLLVSYLENPMPQTVLVWFHPGKKLPMNRKPGTAFKKQKDATVFLADPIHEKVIVGVVERYIKDNGYDIEPKPLHLLVESSGGKFSVIVSELGKVFANVEEGNKIRLEDIQKYVGINKDYNIFALQKAIAGKKKAQAMEIAYFFADNIKNFPLILVNSTLFSYFRKVAMMQSMRGSTEKEVMSALGIPFFAIAEYRAAANHFAGRKMEKAINILNDCDLKLKGIKENTGDDASLLKETVLKLLAL